MMMMKNSLALAFLLASSASAVYDCSKGCSTDPSVAGSAVCGQDGVTYMNECVAICQTVEVASAGACGSSGGRQDVDPSLDLNAVIPAEAMTRFEGLNLVGKRDPSLLKAPSAREPASNTNFFARRESSSTSNTIRRLTKEGYEYVGELQVGDAGDASAFFGKDQSRSLRQRALEVIGADSRTKVTDTTVAPYRAVGQMDYGFGDASEGGCTAAMISRNVAITSGECVYGRSNQDYWGVKELGLGRYRDGANKVEPYGQFIVNDVTVFDDWINNFEEARDIAVLRLNPVTDNGCLYNYPGDNGYFGFARTNVGSVLLEEARITGYQFDKPGNGDFSGEMWTSGAPSSPWISEKTGFATHFLDVDSTGAPVVSSDGLYRIYGIHGYGSSEGNGATIIEEKTVYDMVYAMSERSTSLPSCDGFTPFPTSAPTHSPTDAPTVTPTRSPTDAPSVIPSAAPSDAPAVEDPFTGDEDNNACNCDGRVFPFSLLCRILNFRACF